MCKQAIIYFLHCKVYTLGTDHNICCELQTISIIFSMYTIVAPPTEIAIINLYECQHVIFHIGCFIPLQVSHVDIQFAVLSSYKVKEVVSLYYT